MNKAKKYGKKVDMALALWVKLARAYAVFSRRTEEQIRTFRLTHPQFGVLECLGHLGPLMIGELCRKQLVSGGNMTVVVDNLEKQGLVERTHSDRDRRAIVVRLTAKGQKLFDEIFIRHAEFIAEMASVLSEGEQQELGRLLRKLGKGIAGKIERQKTPNNC